MEKAPMLTRRNMLVLTGLAGMLWSWPARGEDRIAVVTTFSILSDLVKNVGGDEVEVTTLVGPNADVHVYSPTPADAKSLAAAKVVFVNGLGLEGWISRLISASGTKAAKVIVSNGVKPLKMDEGQHPGQTAMDPHAWQSVANAKIYVANIRDGLSSADPANKTIYDTNAKSYLGKLDALEKQVKEVIGRIPRERRKIITSHYAFGYFADAYGLEFISPEGVSTEAEPSANDVAKIIAQIRRQKIPAVFLETITDPRLVQQIANETGAKIGGTLYSDALSEPNGPAGSYIEMMRNNIRQFEKALMS
jgi:zinc/manganese transport system substrate-binding protein